MEIYAINMEHRIDKLEHLKKVIYKPFNIVQGIVVTETDAETLLPAKNAKDFDMDSKTYLGTLGCLVAHKNAFYEIYKKNTKYLSMIIEDDVNGIPNDNDVKNITDCMDYINAEWKVILIDMYGGGFETDIIKKCASFTIFKPSTTFPKYWGSHCYMIKDSDSAFFYYNKMNFEQIHSDGFLLEQNFTYVCNFTKPVTQQLFDKFKSDRFIK